MKNKLTLILSLVIMTLMLGGCGKKAEPSARGSQDGGSQSSGTSTGEADIKPTSNLIRSENQPASGIIYVREIYLEYPGYIALHRLNEDGSLGEMMGLTHAIKGNKEQVDVKLNHPINDGEKLAVVMYKDDGDIKFTDPETDTIVTDDDGKPIMSIITINNSLEPIIVNH